MQVPIDDLHPFPGNARRGDVDVIVSSLETLGQYKPIVVNERDMTILAGNHTWEAARKIGWSHIDAVMIDADEQTARKINVVDNRANDLADYDDDALVAILKDLDDLIGTGWSDEELEKLLTKGLPVEGDADVDDNMEYTYGVVIECASEDDQKLILDEQIALGRKVRSLI